MDVSNYLDTELVDYASYSVLRAIPSALDGLKNSTRKVIYSTLKNLKRETKVSTFAGITAVDTQYLHGDISGSIVTLARDYCGSNNLPLLTPNGNFGTRMIPENSAVRYIFVEKPEYLENIFKDEDSKILFSQEFEGEKIEPKFYTPTIPLLLINGSVGIGTGFSCKILPRSLKSVLKYLKEMLKSGKSEETLLNPDVSGFCGNIVTEPENPLKHTIYGDYGIENTRGRKVTISEIPLGYTLQSYKDFLTKLEESKIIKSFSDESEFDNFKFVLSVETDFFKKHKDIYETLGLKKSYSENFTCLDEFNKLMEFKSPKDFMEYFIETKLRYISKRKDFQLDSMRNELANLNEESLFISLILNTRISFNELDSKKIKEICETYEIENYKKYLKLPFTAFTKDGIESLKNKIEILEKSIKDLESQSPKKIWLNDISNLESSLKKQKLI